MKRVGIKLNRGFTIVEIVVVISIIAVLAIVTTVGYLSYQNQASTAQARSITAQVSAGADKYYTKNNEYISSRTMVGSSDGKTFSNYSALTASYGLSKDQLDTGKLRFAPCVSGTVGLCNILASDKNFIFYMSKDIGSQSVYIFSVADTGCTITFPDSVSAGGDTGPGAYAIAYYDSSKSIWRMYRSQKGVVNISGTSSLPNQTCVFSVD